MITNIDNALILPKQTCFSTLRLNPSLSSKQKDSVERVKSFIASKFKQKHSAIINDYMPTLLELEGSGRISAALGLRLFNQRPFFLEQYFDCSVEIAMQWHTDEDIDGARIVEIGNFAATNARSGSLLFALVAKSLLATGYEWMLFTATDDVEKMVKRLGCEPLILTQAKKSILGDDAEKWGHYYDQKPNVVACNLVDAIANAQKNRRLNHIFLTYALEINELATQLACQHKEVA